MKKFFLAFFFTIVGSLYGQSGTVTLMLKDGDTQKPIEDATVTVVRTKQNFLSNAEGKVSFLLNGTSSIKITHASYQTFIVRSNTLDNLSSIIYLKKNVNDLDEVIITKQHPQKILKNLVDNSIEKLTVSARLKVYMREFFKYNGAYSYYNDGLINFQVSGKDKNFKTDILVEQNRSFNLLDSDVSGYLLGYDLNNIMENYYNFKYLNFVLEPHAKKEFDFLINTYNANPDCYLMRIKPMDNAVGMLDEYTILYDKKKKLILEVTATLSPAIVAKNKEKTNIGAKNLYKSYFKNTYKFDGSNYYLMSSKEEIGFDKVEKKGVSSIEVRNYMVTNNFSTQKFSFSKEDVYKDKTLFNKKNVILSDYWNISGLTATDEELNIINSVEERLQK